MGAVVEKQKLHASSLKKIAYRTPEGKQVKRGDVWLVRLDGAEGSEQTGIRPCVIISNSKGNYYGSTVIIAAVSSQVQKCKLPTHVLIGEKNGMERSSVIMLEQVRTVDKTRLLHKITTLYKETMEKVKSAHAISCSDMFD